MENIALFNKNISRKEIIFDVLLYLYAINQQVMDNKNLNRLKVILAEKNITNKSLAEQLGVGQATVSKWVTNSAQPNLEMLIKLSKTLNVEISELIRMTE